MRIPIAVIGAVLVTAACSDSPRDVAERFWTAAQEGDEETLRETSIESWGDRRVHSDGNSEIGEFSFGETEIHGDEARVETRLTHIDDDASIEVSFETVLERHEGEWLVDMSATTGQMVGSILGTTVRDFADELAEGLQEMGEAIGDAFEESAREP